MAVWVQNRSKLEGDGFVSGAPSTPALPSSSRVPPPPHPSYLYLGFMCKSGLCQWPQRDVEEHDLVVSPTFDPSSRPPPTTAHGDLLDVGYFFDLFIGHRASGRCDPSATAL